MPSLPTNSLVMLPRHRIYALNLGCSQTCDDRYHLVCNLYFANFIFFIYFMSISAFRLLPLSLPPHVSIVELL